MCLIFLSVAIQASSNGAKDWLGGTARLAEEDIERIADRLGERYACTRSTPERQFYTQAQGTYLYVNAINEGSLCCMPPSSVLGSTHNS